MENLYLSLHLENIFRLESLIQINNISNLETILKFYITLLTGKSLIFKTYIPYSVINNLLTHQEWYHLQPGLHYQYLYELNLKNLTYIQCFLYFLKGNILYSNNYRVERSTLFNIFKASIYRQNQVNSEFKSK